MSLTYLTGISGTGKSSVLEQLSNRGFEAHGVDEEGYAVWVNKKTDQVESFEENDPNFNFHSWYQNHRWVLSKKRISELKQLSDRIQKPVILAGLADDEHDALSLFDNIIYLSLDKPTLKKRIRRGLFGVNALWTYFCYRLICNTDVIRFLLSICNAQLLRYR